MKRWTSLERRWRDQIFGALIPAYSDARGELPGLGELALEGFWSDVERTAPPLLRFGLRSAIWLVALSPLWLLSAPRLFGGLTADGRDRLLRRLSSSRWYLIRQVVAMLKAMACLAYLRDPSARRGVWLRSSEAG